VDDYLDAADEGQVRSALRTLVAAPAQTLGAWRQAVVPRLAARFQDALDKEPKGSRPNVEDGELGQILSRWNALGVSAAVSQLVPEADAVFRELLSVLRRNQPRLGRLHKGTPLHELGWLRLRTDPDAATPYILAALIEDVIRDPTGFQDGAAAQVCLHVLGRDPSLFDEVRRFVEVDVPGPPEVQQLARSDPEVLSLVRSMNDPPGSELLQISLHFDPAIGDLLREAVG
jgi:hypothetical protein